ncbi:MAG: hypothetical protein M3178_01965 [Pseudomonadota bacterium]|nr:hypothetical protein [Pseudomonadota bacterium]
MFSIEGALLAALADWHDEPRLFWLVMAGIAGFTATLIIINCIFGLYNKRQISKAMAPIATTIRGIYNSLANSSLPLRTDADRSEKKERK